MRVAVITRVINYPDKYFKGYVNRNRVCAGKWKYQLD